MAAPTKPHTPAAVAMLAREEFEDRRFRGDSYGEMLPMPSVEPKPPAAQPFTIPPWSPEEREHEAALAATEPEPPPMTAVEAMFARARELGELDEPPTVGPPARPLGPLERFQGEPVDWEQVEREALRENRRVAREAARHLLDEEETPSQHPPPLRGAA